MPDERRTCLPADDLRFIFEPRSIAVVGASEDATRMGGGLVLRFLQRHRYRGVIHPVNPKYQQVAGLTCHPSIAAIPGGVDLAVISVPAAAVVGLLSEIPHGHLKAALVLTSGFAEVGNARPEAELMAVARARGIRVIGPNAVGIVNLHIGNAATISQFFDLEQIRTGGLALISQSGAFGTAILAQAEREGLGFGTFVSTGNEADLDFSDYGAYLVTRPDVTAVCGYIEGIRDGAGFKRFASRALESGKPVVVLKAGASKAGAEAARSHTGSLAGSDQVAQAVFDGLGVLRASDGDHMLDLLKMVSRSPSARGRRLAILSHSGGAGVLAADAAEAAGAVVVPLPEDLKSELKGMLPGFATISNPLDMTGGVSLNGKLMADCLRALLAHDAFDGALLAVNLIWREGAVLMRELEDIARSATKPFAVSWVAPSAETASALLTVPYPVFGDPARAARVIAARLVYDNRRREILARPPPARPFSADLTAHGDLSSVNGQARLLTSLGIRLPRETLARSLTEAAKFARTVAGPVAVKIASPDIAHRTEIGAVRIGVEAGAELADAYETVLAAARKAHPDARIDGVLVQEMVQGTEALIGVKRDPVFGPMIAVGAGGTLVELVGRLELRQAPVSREDARRMLATSTLAPLLAGYRGQPQLDAEALAAAVEAMSWLAADRPDIDEIDLNPVVVKPRGQGCVAIDYKFSLATGKEAKGR